MINEDGKVKSYGFRFSQDWNIANITKVGLTIGTAAYMSPEQARSENVDHQNGYLVVGCYSL